MTAKAIRLRSTEESVLKLWNDSKDSKDSNYSKDSKEKYFATFPYPYMNGRLHLGHGFTMSKVDFISRFHKIIGSDVLQPFSFHLTGMPIVSASDKLKQDIKSIENNIDLPENSQYNTMLKMDIPPDQINHFADPKYWAYYFPNLAKYTLERFGYNYDPSRSFITTDLDQYYDKFVKWQFSHLHKNGVLKFGSRYDLFSIKENQPCLGHDRSVGEDAKPHKSYLITFRLDSEYELNFTKILNLLFNNNDKSIKHVDLLVMTSRPETIFGVTNLWINKDLTYGLYQIKFSDGVIKYWICQEYNIVSFKHQYINVIDFQLVSYIKGSDLIGLRINMTDNKINNITRKIYCHSLNYQNIVPSLYVDSTKGTGIIMSVPSESLIDNIGMRVHNHHMNDIITLSKDKGDDCQRYEITPIPIIKSFDNESKTEYNMIAHELLNKKLNNNNSFKIISKDLDEMKIICSRSLNKSIMSDFSSNNIDILKMRNNMENMDNVYVYYEPDQLALSRSGERLIVAKMNQWYIDYGNSQWKELAHNHLNNMHFNNQDVKKSLQIAINWLDQWPCSRSYGLGSEFPKDIINDSKQKYLIDSLSDSTIYMALYTVYHHFKNLNIKPDELDNDVFDFIFLLKEYNNQKYSKYIPLREEFIKWYPLDLRVSARDLINNHLAMCIYNHVIIWNHEFIERLHKYYPSKSHIKSFGPVSYEINGYIQVVRTDNSSKESKSVIVEKMSKSKGNFKTLDQAINMYSADAVRFTFASASNGSDDSYFDQELCSSIIEKLYKEQEWIELSYKTIKSNPANKSEIIGLPEKIFLNEINIVLKDVIKDYHNLNYKNVINKAFHKMQSLRDEYIKLVKNNYHHNTLKYFIKYQLIMMYPIIPFFVDHFLLNGQFINTIMDNKFDHNRMLDIKMINNLTIDMELKWKNDYMKSLIKGMNEKLFSYYSKKKVFNKIKIYTAQKIVNIVDQISYKLITNHINETKTSNSNIPEIETKELIKQAKDTDMEYCKNNKNIGPIIETYRSIKEVIDNYGIELFNKVLSNNSNMEYDTINEMIEYYYQFDKTNNKYKIIGLPNDMTIELINSTDTNMARVFSPVFRFE